MANFIKAGGTVEVVTGFRGHKGRVGKVNGFDGGDRSVPMVQFSEGDRVAFYWCDLKELAV